MAIPLSFVSLCLRVFVLNNMRDLWVIGWGQGQGHEGGQDRDQDQDQDRD
jgi:hypothetical protein